MKRRIDDFRPYTAEEIAFLNRGKDIDTPDVQSAIEEVAGRVEEVASRVDEVASRVDETANRVDEYDPLHRGEGANSVKLGPSSGANGDSSVAFGHGTLTLNEAKRSVALGAGSIAHRESSVAIGTGANSYTNSGIAIGAYATNSDWEGGGDAVSIGSYTFARNQAIAIGLNAEAASPQTVAIGADSGANREHAIAIGTETTANGNNSISIGREVGSNADNSVAVGYGAEANSQNSVAIGPNAESSGTSGIALGDGAQAYSEASISIGAETTTGGGENIALGKGATALDERAVAIGSGAWAQGSNAVAIGPGANVKADNTIVLGTPEHIVIIPGNLEVLGGVKSSVSWIAPSDDVIAEVPNPIEAEWGISDSTGVTEKPLTLRNPGRYRIKGFISSGAGSTATLDILENDKPIINPVNTTTEGNFSVDFTRDIGVNTTLTFRLTVTPSVAGGSYASGRVSQIRICGTETDIGDGVVAW